MKKLIICLVAAGCLCLAGAQDRIQAGEVAASPPVVKPGPEAPVAGSEDPQALYFQPLPDETALPEMRELPVPRRFKKDTQKYTGVIKNKTNHEVNIPSSNSQGTLTIPPQGWIEYISWTRNFDLTVYSEGRPFYCLKIYAKPKNYEYMCSRYDFIAEIIRPEPTPSKKLKKRRIKRRKPKPKQECTDVG